ncbi:MAG TPA: hypothetical protein VN764_00695, partial [Polyangiaceae bacterium]|nr:hypothetical protein [Polyangiaceae bacterium]
MTPRKTTACPTSATYGGRLVLALFATLAWSAGSAAQTSEEPVIVAQEVMAEDPAHMVVYLELKDTQLDEASIRDALSEEFHVPITLATTSTGLTLRVSGRSLSASFKDANGSLVERQLELPEAADQQLTTLVLLSGTIARDESGALLAALTAPPPPVPAPDAVQPVSPPAPASAAPPKTPPAPPPVPPAPSGQPRPLPETFASVSLVSALGVPRDLSRRRTHFHAGLVASTLGSIAGLGATLFVHRNLGLDHDGAGGGVQAAGVYLDNRGAFRGLLGSVLVAYNGGALRGLLIGGLVGLQRGKLGGVQMSGLASWAAGDTVGAQLAGLTSVQVGTLYGTQLAALLSFSTGDMTGVQAATLSAFSGGKACGAQISALMSYAHRGLTGFQMSSVNVARGPTDAVQLGLINVAGDFKGTRLGLINIGGHGRGAQIGLINVSKSMKGAALAPVNIIPGMRHQLLSYVTYHPSDKLEGTPQGPLYHLGLRFLPGVLYTQLGFGIGAESKECVDEQCFGGGMVYAPSFAIGAHNSITKWVFVDADLQYQFIRGFNDSRSSSHQAQARVAVGFQPTPWLGIFAGAGPLLEFYEGPRVDPAPDVNFKWH